MERKARKDRKDEAVRYVRERIKANTAASGAAYWRWNACGQRRVTRRRWAGAAVAAAAILAIVALGWPRVLARVRTYNEARDVRSRNVDRLEADVQSVRAEIDTAPVTDMLLLSAAEKLTLPPSPAPPSPVCPAPP